MIYPYPVISIWWQQGCMIFHMTCASPSLLKRIHLTIFEKIPVYTKYRFNNILRRWYLLTNGNVMWQTVLIAVFDVAFWGTYVLLSIQDNYLVHWWFWIILNVEIVIAKHGNIFSIHFVYISAVLDEEQYYCEIYTFSWIYP